MATPERPFSYTNPMLESLPDGREIITTPITTAEEAYERIVSDAVGRAIAVLGEAATEDDESWMRGAAVVGFRRSPEVSLWTPVTLLRETDAAEGIILAGLPPVYKKDISDRGQWFVMRHPTIAPELATVARDFAFFAVLGRVEARIGLPVYTLLVPPAYQRCSSAERALLPYTAYVADL